jgi:putative Holliday junction resolvase
MSAILGIDLGERRIGVAIAGPDGSAVRPLTTLPRRSSVGADAAAIGTLIETHAVDELVIGLPLEASGQIGTQAAATHDWADELRPLIDPGVRLVFQDERLTSHLAEQRLGPMKRGRSGGPPSRAQRNAYRARVDREAAAIILQDALDARLGSAAEGRP